jgi:dTDP-4-dehydrorhamnose reductase
VSSSRHPGPILLFGADGQTGTELRRTLLTLAPVEALTRRDADLADPAAVCRVVRARTPSLIVNAAAYNAVDRAEEEPDLAMAINGVIPGVLAEEAKRLGAAVVHFSTDYVFGNTVHCDPEGRPRPFREDDPVEPLAVYGRSKLAGEQAIRATSAAHLILRTSWVYSAKARGFLGSLLRLDVKAAELAIVDDQESCPTWAPSLADATAQILAGAWAREGTGALADRQGIYHLAGKNWCSRFAFAAAVFAQHAARGRRTPRLRAVASTEFSSPAARPAFSALDTRRAATAFGVSVPGWQATLPLCLAK